MFLSKMILENQLLLGLSGLFLVIYFTKKYFAGGVCKSQAKLHGKTVIITGSNTGIGKYFVSFEDKSILEKNSVCLQFQAKKLPKIWHKEEQKLFWHAEIWKEQIKLQMKSDNLLIKDQFV